MKLENAQEQLLELSPLKLSQQFSRDDLSDLRDQLKAKRAGLIEAKDKCKNGNSIALLNIELSQVNSMLPCVMPLFHIQLELWPQLLLQSNIVPGMQPTQLHLK